MSLLTTVQFSANLLSLPQPSFVVGNTDQLVIQLYALANEEGLELTSRYDWQILMKQSTFSTLDQPVQTGAVPSDWDHFIMGTLFNRTTRREFKGPLSPQDWQAIQALPALNTIYLYWRLRGNDLLVTPNPAAGDTIAFEYITKNWCQSAIGQEQTMYLLDTDTALLDENIISWGIRWRYLKAKGLDYSEEMKTYEQMCEKKGAREKGAPLLSSSGILDYGPYFPNLPDGNFPGA